MKAIGDPAPDFALPDHEGRTVRLSDLLADGKVVLAFYPADFTPVCTAQACMMRDAHDRLTEAGFFFPETKAASMRLNMRNMWARLALTRGDVRILHGVLRQLTRR